MYYEMYFFEIQNKLIDYVIQNVFFQKRIEFYQ